MGAFRSPYGYQRQSGNTVALWKSFLPHCEVALTWGCGDRPPLSLGTAARRQGLRCAAEIDPLGSRDHIRRRQVCDRS